MGANPCLDASADNMWDCKGTRHRTGGLNDRYEPPYSNIYSDRFIFH